MPDRGRPPVATDGSPHPALLLQTITELSDDAIVATDLAGRVTTWSGAPERRPDATESVGAITARY